MPEETITELASAVDDGWQVMDVREPAEYVGGPVPGAALIPMAQLPSRLGELDRGSPVHVVCASGNRSSAMADFLVRAGLDARSVAGGTAAWVACGRPVVAGNPALLSAALHRAWARPHERNLA